ncbi:DUF1569 domain-containing protein [Silvibacterium acidisoli]|uniref:DUF1569 domain-containing protein n=1 Tax=Acidobacteriaceae bacterium ZG23-2 TaxID=2883246 RepID=UPI00406CADD5
MMKNLGQSSNLNEILTRTAAVSAGDQARWGKMNVGEMICHLTDAFRMSLGERAATAKRFPIPSGVLKWLLFRSSFQWPQNAPTPPELRHDAGGTRPSDFHDDRSQLLQYLDVFAGHKIIWPPHPFLGPLTDSEWMRWGYLHCDHHLRQFGR